jgi:hypothetical protein
MEESSAAAATQESTMPSVLSLLEADYHRTIAASRPPANGTGAPEHSSLPAEELAEAAEDAEAAGYAALGAVAFSDDDADDDDDDSDVNDSGYEMLDGLQRLDGAPDDEELLTMPSSALDPTESACGAGLPACSRSSGSDNGGDSGDRGGGGSDKSDGRGGGGGGRSADTADSSMALKAPSPSAAAGKEWVAEFPSDDAPPPAGALPNSEPPAAAPRRREPLPPDRVDTIKEVMAGLSLAPPQPQWASTVPESVWMQQLLRRTPTDNRPPRRRPRPQAADAAAIPGTKDSPAAGREPSL